MKGEFRLSIFSDYIQMKKSGISTKMITRTHLCSNRKESLFVDWSRFRDDGITTLTNSEYVSAFEQQLQNLHPPDIILGGCRF